MAADDNSQVNLISNYVKIALDIKFLRELKWKLRFWRKSKTTIRQKKRTFHDQADRKGGSGFIVKKVSLTVKYPLLFLTTSLRQLLKICELTMLIKLAQQNY